MSHDARPNPLSPLIGSESGYPMTPGPLGRRRPLMIEDVVTDSTIAWFSLVIALYAICRLIVYIDNNLMNIDYSTRL